MAEAAVVADTSRMSAPRKATRTRTPGRPPTRAGNVRKQFWLDPRLLAQAQRVLGTSTEQETVEMALDLGAFRRELQAGAEALSSLELTRID